MIKCKKCGYNQDESKIQLHHIIPKCIGGTDLDGRVYLCGKCHNILYSIILKWVWDFILTQDKEAVKLFIRERTEVYLKNDTLPNT